MSNEIIQVNKNELTDELKLKEALEKNDVVSIWENCDDYEKLSQTTIKTMQHINDEQVREFTQKLTQTNEKILNLTLQGAKKHHEKQTEKSKKLFRNQLITYSILSFFAGVITTLLWIKFIS